jgi:ubiquinone/menaquinone biosynthesis C-methylase UbiE
MESAKGSHQLGSDAAELERLTLQGRVLAPATRRIFAAAGLGPGMRVLDLGSGMGDVALVAAQLVGSTGEVVGIDQSAETVAKATLRAQQQEVGDVRWS